MSQHDFRPQDVSTNSAWDDYIRQLVQKTDPANLEALKGREEEVIQYRDSSGNDIVKLLILNNNLVLLQAFAQMVPSLDFNVPNNKGDTPLHKAAYGESTDMVQFLLEKGADPNRPNGNNRTPGHNAAFKTRVESLNLMLEHGLNVYLSNNKGRTVIAEAASFNVIYNTETKKFEENTGVPPSNNISITPPPSNVSSSSSNDLKEQLNRMEEKMDRLERMLSSLLARSDFD